MTADLEQKRRTVRVLELLNTSFEAHRRGDREAFKAALDEAIAVDSTAYVDIRGGMTIGEIPTPGSPVWPEYLAVNRDGLARAEEEDPWMHDRSGDPDYSEREANDD